MQTDNNYQGPLGHGAFESPKDERDWTLASAGAPTAYPDAVFLDTEWMKVTNQGRIGSCVANTGEENFRQILKYITGIEPEELSFRFLYAIAKCIDGIPEEGTYGVTIAKIIKEYGVPLAKYCPNDVNLDHESFVYNRRLSNIPSEAFADAATRKDKINYLTEPATMEGLKRAINYAKENKGAVMLIRKIGDTYWTDKNGNYSWDKNKIVPIRVPKTFPFGHAETGLGYDTEPGTNRVRVYSLNHWTDKWADGGKSWEYADEWLPYFREIRIFIPNIPTSDNFKYKFTKTLSRGMKGPDVVALQHVLKLEKCFPEAQKFTGYYGDITVNGVMQLQEKYAAEILVPGGLTHGTGNVGPRTLGWLVNHYGN